MSTTSASDQANNSGPPSLSRMNKVRYELSAISYPLTLFRIKKFSPKAPGNRRCAKAKSREFLTEFQQEDELLCGLVAEYGSGNWSALALKMETLGHYRAGKQCRERSARKNKLPVHHLCTWLCSDGI